MKKKGMLLATETLKIILSLISIGFLIYLLSAIYFNSVESRELAQAEASMKRISSVISRLESGNVSSEEVYALAPSGWVFLGFSQGQDKPNRCAGFDCICICENVGWYDFWSDQIEQCDDVGSCTNVDFLSNFQPIEIQDSSNPSDINISSKKGILEVREI